MSIPLEDQRRAWDEWNDVARIDRLPQASRRQAELVEQVLLGLGRSDLDIIDVGCGSGWMCDRLTRFGRVTGTDFVQGTLEKAKKRFPAVRFVTGDLLELDLPNEGFDVAVSLEVLSHVADQPAFVSKIAGLLRPGGYLILATQNRPVFERWSAVDPPAPDRIRNWVDAAKLRVLLGKHFHPVRVISVVPAGDMGFLRIVNSPKLNWLASRFVPEPLIERAKERAMLGSSLVAVALRNGSGQ